MTPQTANDLLELHKTDRRAFDAMVAVEVLGIDPDNPNPLCKDFNGRPFYTSPPDSCWWGTFETIVEKMRLLKWSTKLWQPGVGYWVVEIYTPAKRSSGCCESESLPLATAVAALLAVRGGK